jgi:inorganic pyrophosphatase
MHPWHDCDIDRTLVKKSFPAIVEIPKGSTNKYELDKETGLLRLDRVLYSAVHYPADYGFIPRTFCDDGDPLDVLMLGQEPVHPLTIVEGRFFEDYKVLENKRVVVKDILGPDEAVTIILEAMDLYGKLRRGELHK